jgi:transporter family protein
MAKMWITLAFLSAIFAGLTTVLAKAGIKNVNSNLATAVRTVIVVIFAWIMVLITGSFTTDISARSLIFLTLSGISTGASWLCYFKALKLGEVSKVVPIDKSSTILTMMLAFVILGEQFTFIKLLCMLLIASGTMLMTLKIRSRTNGHYEPISESSEENKSYRWLIYAFLAAIFAAFTSILGKIGITDIDATLGTAIRTVVVLVMSWLIVIQQGNQKGLMTIDKKSSLFLVFSGIATGISWLCFYTALQIGPASIVVPIDKLSIVITITIGVIVFKEKIKFKSIVGLLLIVLGTVWLVFT